MFAHTSPFRPPPQFSRAVVVPLRKPTADSSVLIEAARAGVRRFYEPGFQLKKAGVILLDLSSSSVHQAELELGGDDCKDQTQLMMTVSKPFVLNSFLKNAVRATMLAASAVRLANISIEIGLGSGGSPV